MEGGQEEQDTQIAGFVEATASDASTARFYLESHTWDLALALRAFFDANDREEEEEDDNDDDDFPDMEAEPEPEAQAPSAGGNGGAPFAQRLLDSAEAVAPMPREGRSPKRERPSAFQGAGYTLEGGLIQQPAASSAPSATGGAAAAASVDELQTRTVRLTFWRNGFSVGDGPLRDPKSAENAAFLSSLEAKILPPELRELDARGLPIRVEIQLADMRNREYEPPPKPRFAAFAGEGRTLGATAPDSPPPRPTAEAAGAAADATRAAGPVRALDEASPSTTLQVRLADGTRLRVRLNHLEHTVRDLYTFVAQAAVGSRDRQRLLAGFPPKELTEMGLTLEQAGLQGAAIVQQLS
jgi:hypothetical protein